MKNIKFFSIGCAVSAEWDGSIIEQQYRIIIRNFARDIVVRKRTFYIGTLPITIPYYFDIV